MRSGIPEATGSVAGETSLVSGGGQVHSSQGALDGGPQCRMSILSNGYVLCRYFFANVDLQIAPSRIYDFFFFSFFFLSESSPRLN